MTSSLPSWIAERLVSPPIPVQVGRYAVRLTRVDNSGDDRVFVETSWLTTARFDTRTEAAWFALGVIKFPHIINVEIVEL